MSILKTKGRCVPIHIDSNVQKQIKKFKERLVEMAKYDEVRDIDAKVIDFIMNKLDPYDQNILIAYYGIADCSASILGKLFNVRSHVITKRVQKITKYVYDRVNKANMSANNSSVSNRL